MVPQTCNIHSEKFEFYWSFVYNEICCETHQIFHRNDFNIKKQQEGSVELDQS